MLSTVTIDRLWCNNHSRFSLPHITELHIVTRSARLCHKPFLYILKCRIYQNMQPVYIYISIYIYICIYISRTEISFVSHPDGYLIACYPPELLTVFGVLFIPSLPHSTVLQANAYSHTFRKTLP